MTAEFADNSEHWQQRRERLASFMTGCLKYARYGMGMSYGFHLTAAHMMDYDTEPAKAPGQNHNLHSIDEPLPSYRYFKRHQANDLDIGHLSNMHAEKEFTVDKVFSFTGYVDPPKDIVDRYDD